MQGFAPEALLNRPKLAAGQEYYLSAFFTLSDWRSAPTMNGPSPLTLADLNGYCLLFEVTSLDLKTTLAYHMKILDNAYINMALKAQQDKPSNSDIPENT